MSRAAIHVPVHEQPGASYDVIVGRGALAELPDVLRERCPAHGYAVIADHHVAELHAKTVMGILSAAGITAQLHTFPAGEWNKSRDSWAALSDALLASRLGRDGAIVALGGGVAGDLAGFVAATYLRGIPYVQVPTSLLAMIDSSIGGKTGVDVPAGKNLVGAFHQPRAVVADIELLATLAKNQIASGAAEAVKHGIIADAGYAASLAASAPRLLARDLDALESAVVRSVAIKGAIVARDERESGLRQVLNFGHTIGHAIESLTGYELLHGEAIAIGMAAEAQLAELMALAPRGFARTVCDLLERFMLPLTIPDNATTTALLDAMRSDKKSRRGLMRCALPSDIGIMAQSADGDWTVEVSDAMLTSAIESRR